MSDLKTKKIGKLNVVLNPVPAREGLLLQRFLGQEVSNAFSKGMALSTPMVKANEPVSALANGSVIAISAIAELLTSMDDAKFLAFVERISKYIFIDGKKLDLDTHFTTDTLIDLYQIIAFFLQGTFGGFLAEIRSRFPQLEQVMLKLSKVPTSTGTFGDPA